VNEKTGQKISTFELQASNVFALSELEAIVCAFNEDEIPLILLKGAAFLTTIYKEKLDRSICDLDLLVHKHDLIRANNQMLHLGYKSSAHNWGNHISYSKPGKHVIPVEIHWDLFNRKNPFQKYAFRMSSDMAWESLQSVSIGRHTTHIMHHDRQILYLSCHLIKESFSDPKWAGDIDNIVRYYRESLDWQKIKALAVECGIRIPVWFVLKYVKELLGTPIPEDLLEDLAGENNPVKAEILMKKIIRDRNVAKRNLLHLYMCVIDKPLDKIRAIIEYSPYLAVRSLMMKQCLNSWNKQTCQAAIQLY